jgi:hypothetical protein
VFGLSVFCLVRSTGICIVCVLFGAHSIQSLVGLTKQNTHHPNTCESHQTKHTQSYHLWISPNNTLNPNTYGSHQTIHTQSKHLWISPSKTHTIQTHADLTKCCTALWMFSATLVTFQLYIFIGRGKRRKPPT